MGWVSGTVVYFLIWWVTLFAVLPVGAHPDAGSDPDTGWRGVPQRPRLLRKAVITTVISGLLWVAVYVLVDSDWLSFRTGWLSLPEK